MSSEPIRGQMSTAFWDSEGKLRKKARWITETTYRALCAECGQLIPYKGKTEVKCDNCDTVNDLT